MRSTPTLLVGWVVMQHRDAVLRGLAKGLQGVESQDRPEEHLGALAIRLLENAELRERLLDALEHEDEDAVRGLLYGTSRWVAAEEWRKEHGRREYPKPEINSLDELLGAGRPVLAGGEGPDADPQEQWLGILDVVRLAFNALRPPVRRVLREMYLEARTPEAIARRMTAVRRRDGASHAAVTLADVLVLVMEGHRCLRAAIEEYHQ